MKKHMVVFGLFLSTFIAYAGGDLNMNISSVADISKQDCKANKIYQEKDTQLIWQDQAYTDAEDGAYAREHSLGKVGSWNYAMNYCRSSDYYGYSDWRLPTSNELQHVHHKEGQDFSYHRDKDFWTSTPSTTNRYYVVYPVDAYRYKRKKSESNYIRCVRCEVKKKKTNLYKIINDETQGENDIVDPTSVDIFK